MSEEKKSGNRGLNTVVLMGNLGADPELRATQSGQPVMNLRLAVTTQRKSGEEWVDETNWFTVVVWGGRAEGLARILKKGDRIVVQGRLSNREWEKDGVKHYATEVVALEVCLAGGGKRGSEEAEEDEPAPVAAKKSEKGAAPSKKR